MYVGSKDRSEPSREVGTYLLLYVLDRQWFGISLNRCFDEEEGVISLEYVSKMCEGNSGDKSYEWTRIA
jgi:hypothetical protein